MEEEIQTWRVRCYLEYDLEARCEEEAIFRLQDAIMEDLRHKDIRDVAEVGAEKISDTGIEEHRNQCEPPEEDNRETEVRII